MNEKNKQFLSPKVFSSRVEKVLKYKGMSLDDLHKKINDIGYEITKNNLSLYLQRTPSVYFLIAISRALGISTDYLLGMKDDDAFSIGLDYKYDEDKYKKYINKYYFYFYPTSTNSPTILHEAVLTIEAGAPYKAMLEIITPDNDIKKYVGELLLSSDYQIGYIMLKGVKIGEIVLMSFCDPVINNKNMKVETILGSMLSISSGDMKRVPVMSRFFISHKQLDDDEKIIIKSQLLLNSKYIRINEKDIKIALNETTLTKELIHEITHRLTSAFSKKNYYSIEESFLLNTLKNDYRFSLKEIEDIIAQLRVYSINDANSKINRTLDSRIFFYLKNKNNTN